MKERREKLDLLDKQFQPENAMKNLPKKDVPTVQVASKNKHLLHTENVSVNIFVVCSMLQASFDSVQDMVGRALPTIGSYGQLDNRQQVVALIDPVSTTQIVKP